MATLGIKPRKPRGRGRGSKVNMGDREPQVVQAPVEPVQTTPMKPEKVSAFYSVGVTGEYLSVLLI